MREASQLQKRITLKTIKTTYIHYNNNNNNEMAVYIPL